MSLFIRLAALVSFAALALVASAPSASAQATTVPVGDIWFCSDAFQNGTCVTEISAGDSVTWDFSAATLPHTTTSDDGVWDSDIVQGGTFSFTFNEAGTFAYHCNVHPGQMLGQIVVSEAAPAPDEETPDEDDGDAAPTGDADDGAAGDDAAGDDVAKAPVAGFGPGEASSDFSLAIALGAAGLALTLAGTALRFGRR